MNPSNFLNDFMRSVGLKPKVTTSPSVDIPRSSSLVRQTGAAKGGALVRQPGGALATQPIQQINTGVVGGPRLNPGPMGVANALSIGAVIGQHMEQNTPINRGGSGRGAGRAAFSPKPMVSGRGGGNASGMQSLDPKEPSYIPPLGEQGYKDLTGPPSGLEGQPLPSSGVTPKTTGDGGAAPSPTGKTTSPYPTNLKDAYAAFVNDYTGASPDLEKIDKFVGDKARARYNLGEQDVGQVKFQADPEVNFGQGYGKGMQSDYSGAFTQGAKTEGDAFTSAPEGFESVLKPRGKGAFAGMREEEYNAGVLYASGKYWMEGEGGKLEEIKGPEGARTTLRRADAIAIARNKRNMGDVTGAKPAETSKSTLTAGELPGGSPFTRTSGKEDPITPAFSADPPEISYEGKEDLPAVQQKLGNIYDVMNTEGAKLRALEDQNKFRTEPLW